MSHPAVVGYQNEDGTYDLHYSRNGAERYQLRDVLTGYLEGKYEKKGSDMPPLLPTEVAEYAADYSGIEIIEYDLISETPFAEDIEMSSMQYAMPSMGVEMLYLIHDWEIDVYSIVPITPSLLPTLAASVDAILYNCKKMGITPQETTLEHNTPTYSLSSTDYFDLSIYQEMSTRLYFTLSQFHLDLLDAINIEYQNGNSKRSDSPTTTLYHDGCLIEYTVDTPVTSIPWSSLFINVWPDENTEAEYHWAYEPEEPSPRSVTNQLRLELSMLHLKELRDDIIQITPEPRSEQLILSEYRKREFNRFVSHIRNRYQDGLATELIKLDF